jgi:hypothetical protein
MNNYKSRQKVNPVSLVFVESHSNKNLSLNKEKGMAIVVLSIIIVALVILLAISVDISTLGTSISQGRGNARYAALAAIEAYFSTKSEDRTERLSAAEQRLNEIASLNKVISGFSGQTALSTGAGAKVEMTPGRWYYSRAADGSNPCADNSEPPCFVSSGSNDPINAFRIRGDLYEEVKTFFSGILGNSSHTVSVDVVSTITPRQGCFLIDLSPSMTRETHISSSDHGATYGFYLKDPVNPGAAHSWHDTRWNQMNALYPTRDTSSYADPRIHYADDYRLFSLLDNAEYSGSNSNSNYRRYHPDPFTDNPSLQQLYEAKPARYWVDVRRMPGYGGPEPLTAIMKGLQTAVRLFKERSVAGDKMCLVFFDHLLSWPRVVKLTDNYEYIETLLTLRDPSSLMDQIDPGTQHGLFPSKDSFTNILMALTEAERQFKKEKENNPGLPVSQFMVLITDGLPNCRACDQTTNPTFDRNGDNRVNFFDRMDAEMCARRHGNGVSFSSTDLQSYCSNMGIWGKGELCKTAASLGLAPGSPQWNHLFSPLGGCSWLNTNGDNQISLEEFNAFLAVEADSFQCDQGGGCQNDFASYALATKELKAYVERTIAPQRIPIHVMMVGRHVAPNTRDIGDPATPGRCLSDSEIRQNNLSKNYVAGASPPYRDCLKYYWQDFVNCELRAVTDFRDMNDSKPFRQANVDMFDITLMTRGIWAPLRHSSDSCVPNQCLPNTIRLEDPLCRSVDEQVASYMEQIMGQNPYTIAYSN